MWVAALGDIHGHLAALEAVLREIDEAGIQTILNTGDCVVGHPWPNEVIDVLRSRAIPTVQGELDRRTAHFVRKRRALEKACAREVFESLQQTYEAMRSEHLEYLAGLPRQRTLVVDGISICLTHGTPNGQTDTLHADDPPTRFHRLRELAHTDVIVCGRTHQAFCRLVDGTLFVNPGAVGLPAGEDTAASYAVIDTETEPWEGRLHQVRS
jgi:putative phosphoesterase